MSTLSDATRAKLMGVSVATLSTALFKRGLRNQTIQDIAPVAAKGRNMVGPAYTRATSRRARISTSSRSSAIPRTRNAPPSKRAHRVQCLSWTAARTRAPPRPARSWSAG